eukprot:CAMPEP_0113624544 /NCGR_PEP_ID=MMETSP0017_2-20120614/12656_1 /TAXON_ID=2856 /ORGANISM="Cylindrotheca closterium" /LENGTH=83 /DNA_ID=CAMNT_0000534585 /DNA_START=34 /DNA_END=285 /DNA_ORIENTATION=+ /assembly_acc=CAM_ASM_000147
MTQVAVGKSDPLEIPLWKKTGRIQTLCRNLVSETPVIVGITVAICSILGLSECFLPKTARLAFSSGSSTFNHQSILERDNNII